MFVATFYSFKGGVGRTMALANVAAELAQNGSRVLVVDFDLEAPGIDTLPLPKPLREQAGIAGAVTLPKTVGDQLGVVDYVTDYLASDESPDVAKYVYESPGVGRKGGRLFVMPAGRREAGYAQRFNDIDWADLYANHDGYLMFEDLKAQWANYLAPDYVLIDSRTGHTDVSGICTRHLPDAVVILFIPNEQNLRGLERIVPDIRQEAESPRHREIELLFVMSNVPDLDDEEEILSGRVDKFTLALNINAQAQLETIHRYDSLHLLNQAIFTREKPKSRLAQEYRRLAHRVKGLNPEDKEGAAEFIRQLRSDPTRMSPADTEKRLAAIDARHPADAEIRQELASLRKAQGRWTEALRLFDELVALGHLPAISLLERAEVRLRLGEQNGIAEDVLHSLRDPSLDYYRVDRAIELLRRVNEKALEGIGQMPAVASQSPDIRLWIGQHLRRSEVELTAGLPIFASLASEASASLSQVTSARSELAFNLVGLREMAAAVEQIATNRRLGIESDFDRFNSAMAGWATHHKPPVQAFAAALPPKMAPPNPTADLLQRWAVIEWVVGRSDRAREFAQRARNAAMSGAGNYLSFWRYREVSTEAFLDDVGALLGLIDGKQIEPPVVEQA